VEGANFLYNMGRRIGAVYQSFQIRKPLTPSSITTFIKISIFKRFVVRKTSFLAGTGSKQGIKNEYPRLKSFHLIL
jgi:hypothetical protein